MVADNWYMIFFFILLFIYFLLLFLFYFFTFLFCLFCFCFHFVFNLFSSYSFTFLNFSYSFFFFCFFFCFSINIFFISFRFLKWNEMKTTWLRTNTAPKTMMAEDWHTDAQQQYVRLNDAKNSHVLHVPHEWAWSKYYFSSKSIAPGLPRFSCYFHLKKQKTYMLHYPYYYIETVSHSCA